MKRDIRSTRSVSRLTMSSAMSVNIAVRFFFAQLFLAFGAFGLRQYPSEESRTWITGSLRRLSGWEGHFYDTRLLRRNSCDSQS